MPNYPSSTKRLRQSFKRRARNHYKRKTTRTFLKKLRSTTSKDEAQKLYNRVSSMLDKLAKNNLIHKNKAANQKSKLARYVNTLS